MYKSKRILKAQYQLLIGWSFPSNRKHLNITHLDTSQT